MTKVLIIDDDPDSLDTLDELLQQQNFETLKAADGEQGIQLAQEQHPNLIICDVMMPKLDGYALLSELRNQEITARIPFIFLTGKADRSDLRLGMELGADNYLTKPLNKKDLLRAITVCLSKYRILAEESEQQQSCIESLQQQLQESQELTAIYSALLRKVSQELRHPISNLYVAIQMLGESSSEVLSLRDRTIFENECIRAISILNEVSTFQELLQTSKVTVLQQLLSLDQEVASGE